MLFSIITVTRNNLGGLQRTQASVAAQSCADYEWLVIDGASEDGTVEFLHTTAAQWISEKDSGLYDAMNKGLARAQGQYVILMNAGDSFAANDVLRKVKDAIAAGNQPPAFIYGDALEEQPGKAPLCKPARSHQRITAGMFTHHQAMIYSRALIGALRFNTNYKIAADYKFTATLLQETPAVLYLNFPLCLFEAGGISQRRVALGRQEQFRARQELALCGPLRNAGIYMAQTAALRLRRLAPRLYWWLRRRV